VQRHLYYSVVSQKFSEHSFHPTHQDIARATIEVAQLVNEPQRSISVLQQQNSASHHVSTEDKDSLVRIRKERERFKQQAHDLQVKVLRSYCGKSPMFPKIMELRRGILLNQSADKTKQCSNITPSPHTKKAKKGVTGGPAHLATKDDFDHRAPLCDLDLTQAEILL